MGLVASDAFHASGSTMSGGVFNKPTVFSEGEAIHGAFDGVPVDVVVDLVFGEPMFAHPIWENVTVEVFVNRWNVEVGKFFVAVENAPFLVFKLDVW